MLAPSAAARSMEASTFSIVPSRLCRTGEICTAAARMIRFVAIACLVRYRIVRGSSQGPRIENKCIGVAMEQDDVEHIQRADGDDSRDQRSFAMAVEGLQG